MIKNYFKTAWRNLIYNKAFTGINIIGLALGLVCSLLIMLWVRDEYSVDAFHRNGNQLYYAYERKFEDGQVNASYYTQGLLANELKANIPEIKYASSLEAPGTVVCEAGSKIIVGLNKFTGGDEKSSTVFKVDDEIRNVQSEKLKALRNSRDGKKVTEIMERLKSCAASEENLMPVVIEAVENYATLGEIAGALRTVFGEYKS